MGDGEHGGACGPCGAHPNEGVLQDDHAGAGHPEFAAGLLVEVGCWFGAAAIVCSHDGGEGIGDGGGVQVVADDLGRVVGGYGQGPGARQGGDQLAGARQRDDSGAGVGGHEFADFLGERLGWDGVSEQFGEGLPEMFQPQADQASPILSLEAAAVAAEQGGVDAVPVPVGVDEQPVAVEDHRCRSHDGSLSR